MACSFNLGWQRFGRTKCLHLKDWNKFWKWKPRFIYDVGTYQKDYKVPQIKRPQSLVMSVLLLAMCSSVRTHCMVESSWNVMAHGHAREGKWRGNWRMAWVANTLHTTSLNMVYPALLPLMHTPRLPAVDWTDVPADLNGLVRFAERRNLVSARVPSHFKRSLTLCSSLVRNNCWHCCSVNKGTRLKHDPLRTLV
jgi:hypothetical protein